MERLGIPETEKKKKRRLIFTIETEEEARRAIKHSSAAFIILAVIFLMIGLFIWEESSLVLALIMGALGFTLLLLRSRIAALLMLLFSLIGIIPFVIKTLQLFADANYLIFILLLWASIKAVEATFKLHRLSSSTTIE